MLAQIFALTFFLTHGIADLGPDLASLSQLPAPESEAVAAPAPVPEEPGTAPAPEPAAAPQPTAGSVVKDAPMFALPLLAQTGRLSASQVVAEVQDFYKKTKHLQAKFRQTVHDPVFGRDTTSDGKVYIEKPGKMRWDYYGKATRNKRARVTKSFISDGKTLWAVHRDDKTVLQKSLEQNLLPVAVTFLYGEGDLAEDFDAELDTSGEYGRKGDYVLELTPKQPSAQYKKLWLVVDPSNYRVKQSIVLNAKGETNAFRFFEPKTGKPIKDKYFVFNMRAAREKGYRKVEVKEGGSN